MRTDFASLAIEQEYVRRTGSLDLGNCGLAEVPRVVWEDMPWLLHLNFAHNYVIPDLDEWFFSENMGLDNNIARLPDSVPNLPLLKSLELSGWIVNQDLMDLGPLVHLKSLEFLGCSSTDVRDLEPLRGLTNLKWLTLAYLLVDDLDALRELTKLKALVLYHTSINDLDALSGLMELTNLDCSQTSVHDLGPLAGLPNLKYLDISNTKVVDLSPMAEMVRREKVWFSKKAISGPTGINVEGLEITNPPREVMEKGREAFLDYCGNAD